MLPPVVSTLVSADSFQPIILADEERIAVWVRNSAIGIDSLDGNQAEHDPII